MKHPDLIYTSPNQFTTKQRLALALAPPAGALFLKALRCSDRVTVDGTQHQDQVVAAHGRFIIALWHEYLSVALGHFRNTGYHTLTSYSYDGELAARMCEQFGLHALRGSSSRGGREGLHQMKKALDLGITVGFTLDGPRGPRRVAKPGVALLAALTQLPVLPVAFAAKPAWRLRSWDRFAVPKPFGHIATLFGPPIPPPARGGIEEHRLRVERSLNDLQRQLEEQTGCGDTSIAY